MGQFSSKTPQPALLEIDTYSEDDYVVELNHKTMVLEKQIAYLQFQKSQLKTKVDGLHTKYTKLQEKFFNLSEMYGELKFNHTRLIKTHKYGKPLEGSLHNKIKRNVNDKKDIDNTEDMTDTEDMADTEDIDDTKDMTDTEDFVRNNRVLINSNGQKIDLKIKSD